MENFHHQPTPCLPDIPQYVWNTFLNLYANKLEFDIILLIFFIASFPGPGPGAHSPEKVPPTGPRQPAWTMAPRTDMRHDSFGPGPLAYNLPSMLGPKVPNKHASGAYTM